MTDNRQIVNQPNLYANGLDTAWASVTTLTVGAGTCRDDSPATGAPRPANGPAYPCSTRLTFFPYSSSCSLPPVVIQIS